MATATSPPPRAALPLSLPDPRLFGAAAPGHDTEVKTVTINVT
jgi:hypothetical protein